MRSPIDYNRMTRIAMLGALAIVLSTLENLLIPELPFLPPGAKPGLSNIVTMIAAINYGVGPSVYIIIIKAIFVLITRGGSAFAMSLAGGVLSGAVMIMMLKLDLNNVSYIGISVIAAAFHNMGQLIMSMVLTGSAAMINYLPLLLVFAVISGVITGIMVQILLPRIQVSIDYSTEGGDYG